MKKKSKKVWVGWIPSHRKVKELFEKRHCLGLVPRVLQINGAIFGKKIFPDDQKIKITVRVLHGK